MTGAPWTWPGRFARKPSVVRRLSRLWQPEGGTRVNLACGTDYRPGWTNIDLFSERVDVRWDLLRTPWPLEADSVDWLLADALFEHVPQMIDQEDGLLRVLREVQRVLRARGRCLVIVPYFGSMDDGTDIFHYRHFTEHSFDFLGAGPGSSRGDQARLHRLRLRKKVILRRWSLGRWFSSNYHLPKYLHWDPNVGRKDGLVFLLEKT